MSTQIFLKDFRTRETTEGPEVKITFATSGPKGDPGPGIPDGGLPGQVLGKTGPTDQEAGWLTIFGLPEGGQPGDILFRDADESGRAYWGPPPAGLPDGGSVGYVLTRGMDSGDLSWDPLPDSKVPRGGSPGQVLTKSGSGDYQSQWATPATGGGTSPITAWAKVWEDGSLQAGNGVVVNRQTEGVYQVLFDYSRDPLAFGVLVTPLSSGASLVASITSIWEEGFTVTIRDGANPTDAPFTFVLLE